MSEKRYRDYDGINGEPTEFEWNIFPGFTTLQLCGKINDLLSDLGQTPETFTGRILFISCSMTSLVTEIKKNVWQMPESSKYLQRDLVLDNGHLLVQVLKKKWSSGEGNSPQGAWDNIAEQMLLEFADILLSVQRHHCPGVFSRAKDMENCQYISLQITQQLKQFFAK